MDFGGQSLMTLHLFLLSLSGTKRLLGPKRKQPTFDKTDANEKRSQYWRT